MVDKSLKNDSGKWKFKNPNNSGGWKNFERDITSNIDKAGR